MPEESIERRQLTPAEIVYVERLNTNLLHAQQALNDAVDFLREQHSAPARGGWQLNDLTVGFERNFTDEDVAEMKEHLEEMRKTVRPAPSPEYTVDEETMEVVLSE